MKWFIIMLIFIFVVFNFLSNESITNNDTTNDTITENKEDTEKIKNENLKKTKKITKEEIKNYFTERPLLKPGIAIGSTGLALLGVGAGLGISSIISYNRLKTEYSEYENNPDDDVYNELEQLRKINLAFAISSFVLLPIGVLSVTFGIISFFIKKSFIEKIRNKTPKEKKVSKLSFDLGIWSMENNACLGVKFNF